MARDPKNVKKLAAEAQQRKAAKIKKEKPKPTVAGRMRRMGDKPKPKGQPTNVLKLITDALKRKGQ